MKEFTSEEKYTTLEQSKILEPIMDKLWVKADGFWDYFEVDGVGLPVDCAVTVNEGWFVNHADINDCKQCDPDDCQVCYRLDTLLWVLPDWCFNPDIDGCWTSFLCAIEIPANLKLNEYLQILDDRVQGKFIPSPEGGLVKVRTVQQYLYYLFAAIKYKGKEAIAAAVQLIKLLDENNLLETRK